MNKEIKCSCGDRANYSVAITNTKTGETKVIDYCTRCIPKLLLVDMKKL